MDSGKITGLVFIGLKRAFDTFDHSILCQKFEHYGATVNYWGLDHTLEIEGNFTGPMGVDSRTESIETGVAQGSCLGPLLL